MKIYACFLLALFATTGCDNATATGATGIPPIRIAGTWTYTGEVSDPAMTASCQMTGTANLNQTNDTFNGLLNNGSQVCLFGGERTEDPLYGPVTAGEIGGESVRFRGAGCLHTGTISGSPANHMDGVFSCSFSLPPETPPRTFSGTWQANR
jgi:hypothetical protein